MKRRERLMATLKGEAVDRPPVSFYELNGLDENPNDPDPFNIYTHPSWQPLIELTKKKTDRIVMRHPDFSAALPDPLDELTKDETFIKDGSRFTIRTIKIGKHILTSRTRQDQDVYTTWTEEHLLKNTDDLKAYLQVPPKQFSGTPDISSILETEAALGDTGIVMINTGDPLGLAASLFDMAEFTIVAMTEPKLFQQLLEHCAVFRQKETEAIAKALPGRLWRIYGPEYASAPYLPPALFREYVCRYEKPMIDAIQRHGGFARVHSHGNLKDILDDIVAMEPDGLDPIEPPPQGDVELRYVREKYGKDLVLFGNLEASDIENMPTEKFAGKVIQAIEEGMSGKGRGFVLMPSSCPYGRELAPLALKNYEKIIEIIETR